MSIKGVFEKAKGALGEKAPEILVGLGIVSIGAGVFFACKATLKIKDKKEEIKEEFEETVETAKSDMEEIDDGVENSVELKDGSTYTAQDGAKDKALVYKQTAGKMIKTSFKVAKEYAPAVGFLVTGIALVLFSHKILRDRNAALLTAYTALDSAFKVYRQRVIAKGGKELDAEFLYGTKTEVTEKTVTNPETGLEEKIMETTTVPDYPLGSPYARIFDKANSVNYEDADSNNWYNEVRLRQSEKWANDMLNAKGYLFLNEVYEHLGFEPSQEGQFVGWLKGTENGGDGYVDFNIDLNVRDPRFKDLIEHYGHGPGRRRKIVLDFNVDGVIYDKVYKRSDKNGLSDEQLKALQDMKEETKEALEAGDERYVRMEEEAYAAVNK